MAVGDYFRNLWKGSGDASLRELLPPALVDVLLWTRDTVPRGLGFADRTGHLIGTFALALVMVIASLTLLTWLAIAYLIVMLPIALLRFFDAVDSRWPVDESSWPFWTVREEGFKTE
ncbi:MAG: hypothetical protein V5A16_05605 [Haloplanus sp.]